MNSVDLAGFPESSPNPVIETDETGQVYYANPAAQSLFPDLMIQPHGHPFLQELKTIFHVFRVSGTDRHFKEIKVKDRHFAQHVYIVPDNHHARIYAFDITEKVKSEHLGEHLGRQLATVFDAVMTPLFYDRCSFFRHPRESRGFRALWVRYDKQKNT